MENFVTDAINIKTYPLSENDNIVVMLSRKNGLIRGVAKGVKRPKSKLGGRMQVLVANKLLLRKGRNLDTITQAQALNTFSKLRQDLDKLTYSMYLAEIVGIFCEENLNTEKIYDDFYVTLENISNADNKVQILLSVLKFQLHFMTSLGLGIELNNCLFCNAKIPENPLFSHTDGGVVCLRCQDKILQKIKIPTKVRDFLNELSCVEVFKKTKYYDLANEKVTQICFNLLKQYIQRQSSKKIKSLGVFENAGAFNF